MKHSVKNAANQKWLRNFYLESGYLFSITYRPQVVINDPNWKNDTKFYPF